MYYKFQRRYNLLNVADTYAQLTSVNDDGSLVFEFRYTVSQRDAITHSAMTVNVSVLSRTIKPKPLLGYTEPGKVNSRQLVSNILTQMPDAKSALKKQEDYVVSSRNSDISSAINNEIVGQLMTGGTKNSIQQLNQTRLRLVPSVTVKQANAAQPVLTRTISPVPLMNSASINVDPQHLMHDMIVRQGVDPSVVLQLTDRTVSASDSVGGTRQPTTVQEHPNSVSTQLLNYYVFNPSSSDVPKTSDDVVDSESMHVLTNDASEDVELALSMVISKASQTSSGTDVSHFFVKFDMVDGKTGVTIDTVLKPLDVARHIQLFNTPRIPPVVKAARAEVSSRLNLEITQVDPGAQAVNVYKKVFWRATTDVDDYTLVGTYNVKASQQPLLVQVDKPVSSVAIYRVIPVGAQGTVSAEFTNVVVKPSTYMPIKSVALVVGLVDTGVQLEIRKIPQSVVAVEFMRKNKTTFEGSYSNVGGDRVLIDPATRVADHVSIIDTGAVPNNVYEYVMKLIYASGEDELSQSAHIEVIRPDPGAVNTVVNNLVVSHNVEPDVAFDLQTTIVDTNNDTIKALLKRQDLYDQFKDNVLAEREFLTSLIAHNVQRVDLFTGHRVDFGVLSATSFNDQQLRQNQAIPALEYGHRYRYEIQPLLRAPETMFQTLNKTATDQTTSKTYTYNPAKFLHPVALTQGTLVTQAGLNSLFPKEAMSWGALSAPTAIEVSLDGPVATIVDATAAQFDERLNTLSWKVQGEINRIDHFVIMTDVNGARTLIGKAHSEFQNGMCQYLHPLTRTDIGEISYIIVPVFDDYKVGDQVETNSVLIEEVPQ